MPEFEDLLLIPGRPYLQCHARKKSLLVEGFLRIQCQEYLPKQERAQTQESVAREDSRAFFFFPCGSAKMDHRVSLLL